jgi:hypothetical protein
MSLPRVSSAWATLPPSPGTTIFRSKLKAVQSQSAHFGTQHLGCFTELTRPYSMPARDPSATGKLKDSLP